jgi:hypothetical protein
MGGAQPHGRNKRSTQETNERRRTAWDGEVPEYVERSFEHAARFQEARDERKQRLVRELEDRCKGLLPRCHSGAPNASLLALSR